MNNGFIIVNKERGFTSFDVCAKLRGILKTKKIGHTGTLDPDATGVLLVCVGNATKAVDILPSENKEYRAVIHFGITTDTEDISGEVLNRCDDMVTGEEIKAAVQAFIGDIKQIPPMYSAIKVGGKKLYELAREGKIIERKPRDITIHDIRIESIDYPFATITVSCSKGTYIRTLCKDIGEKLNVGACMESLERTKACGFDLNNALTLSEIEKKAHEGKLDDIIIPTEELFKEYNVAYVKESAVIPAQNGNRLKRGDFEETPEKNRLRVHIKEQFIGIYEYDKDRNDYKPFKMFFNQE
ncbi:MAG: tRNA pseudouridine(55) synthase TruB [Lachnospiraceae bacterium]|nr:tRNA pseudouridine(55) synthase TruB [Lachnospiraceae bacterium]